MSNEYNTMNTIDDQHGAVGFIDDNGSVITVVTSQ